VLAANQAGMDAVWFNPVSKERRAGEKYRTLHNLLELIPLIEA
jgi:FMN phosphatase YigB (HAD superfamily)